MTTPVKQLHDENDAAFYPQTAKAAIADYDAPSIEVTENDPGVGVDLPANSFVAVVGEGPSFDDLVFADDPTEPENPSPWVTGSMIDFDTFSGSGYFYIGDILVQWGTKDFGSQSFAADYWGSMRRSSNESNYFNYPIPFSESPIFIATPKTAPVVSVQFNGNASATRTPSMTLIAPSNATSSYNTTIQWIAIGKK